MGSQNDPHYFSNISNAVIINPTVTHVNGNIYNNSEVERYGAKLLLANISPGAFHDAAERGDPPRCHPQTRTAIRAEIMEWIQAPDAMRKLILWMYGPAGSGKTAIAQSIAEECKRQGLLAASFFFGRTATGRNDTSRFVATIAYQISQSIPQVQERLISAVEQNPTIFSLALTTQMAVLLIEPLKSLPPMPRPIFVITDGVDECGPNRESHTHLLNALGTAISELRHISLICLIASRPEYEIREAFNGKLLSPLVKSLVLDNDYKPNEDIRLYLSDKFREIRDEYIQLDSHLPLTWPTETDVDRLVSKASGQFIFASTVMKFIDSPRYHPQERLNIILGLLAPGNETPFAQLDALYHFILSSVADLPKVLEVLKFLILADYNKELLTMTVDVTEAFLGFAIGPVLVDMHALVFVPPKLKYRRRYHLGDPRSYIGLRIHHASLYDFLTDRSRSRTHYIDVTQGHIALSRRWLNLIANYPDIPTPLSLRQCLGCFIVHCEKLSAQSSEIASDLASFSLKMLLDKMSDRDNLYIPLWNEFITCARNQAGARNDVFPRLRNEFDAFVLENLSQYPSTLQALIPTIIVYGDISPQKLGTSQDIFHLCLYALYPSETELAEGRRLDSTLLNLYNVTNFDFFQKESSGFESRNIFYTLFKSRSRAGQFFVDGRSYAILAKQMIRAVCPMPGRDTHRVEFVQRNECEYVFNSDGSYPTIRIPGEALTCHWLADIIDNASADLELAMLLRERVLQFNHTEEHYQIAKIGLKYVQRCGIPYMKHTHLSNMNSCIVCTRYRSTSVVIDNNPSLVPGVAFFGSPWISIWDHLGFLRGRWQELWN